MKLKILIFPADNVDMDSLLQMLADSPGRFIIRYEADGVRCIQIVNWKKYQRPHIKELESQLPEPPSDVLSREKVGASREKVGASREKVGASREKVVTSTSGQRSEVRDQRADVDNPLSPTPCPHGDGNGTNLSQAPSSNGNRTEELKQAAEKVMEHWNGKPTLPRIKDGPTRKRKDCLRVIADRLKEGYSVEELIEHVDRYDGKRRAHQFWERKSDPPDINSRYWCPNVNWTPDEIFGPERFGKYFTVWCAEQVITGRELEDEYARRVYGQ